MLDDLPRDVLHLIMGQLEAKDLAALSAQTKYLRSEAGEEDLWKPLLEARWPNCCTTSDYSSSRSLYSARAAMPASFGVFVDKVAGVQRRMVDGTTPAALSGPMFQDTMRSVYTIGSLVDLGPPGVDVRQLAEHKRLVSVMCWWLEHKTKVAVAFVRDTSELVLEGGSHLQVGWRRSAIAFLADLLRRAPAAGLHPSVFEALRAATASLNASLLRASTGSSASLAPSGVPASHWWWSRGMFGGVCGSPSRSMGRRCQVSSPA